MLTVEQWPIDKLIPYARNPRKNDEQVDRMVSAIKEFGFRIPIVARSDGSVVDGHLRLKAAKKMGMSEVPVALADELTPSQVKAFRLLANQSANWAEWDTELLKLELEELKADGYDMELTGFDDSEILEMTESPVEGLKDQDDVPTVEESEPAISKPGDVWLLGDHRLMCGDSLNFDNMAELMLGESADMWLTDPPYNVSYVGATGLKIENDDMPDEDFRQFLRDAYSSADTVMRKGAVFYIWHADIKGDIFRAAAKDVGWTIRQCLIWYKNTLVLGRQDYQWQHEPCLYGWKDGAAHTWASDRKQTTVLSFDKPLKNGEHPTMKPVALFEYLMLNSTRAGDIVLDSFGGSGTTIIAAEKNGRKARVMELSEKYCDVIVRRWQDFSGKSAILESSGKNFDEIAMG